MIVDKIDNQLRKKLESMTETELRRVDIVCPYRQGRFSVTDSSGGVLVNMADCKLVNSIALRDKARLAFPASRCVYCKLAGEQVRTNPVILNLAKRQIKNALSSLHFSPQEGLGYEDLFDGLSEFADSFTMQKYLYWLFRHNLIDETGLVELTGKYNLGGELTKEQINESAQDKI